MKTVRKYTHPDGGYVEIITFKDPYVRTCVMEYDSSNRPIYTCDSDGEEHWYMYADDIGEVFHYQKNPGDVRPWPVL